MKRKPKTQEQWTEPYHGVSHLGHYRAGFRCTINIYPKFTILHRYHRVENVCRHHSETTYKTAAGARNAGRRWFNQNFV